jgi:hypothetical protein
MVRELQRKYRRRANRKRRANVRRNRNEAALYILRFQAYVTLPIWSLMLSRESFHSKSSIICFQRMSGTMSTGAGQSRYICESKSMCVINMTSDIRYLVAASGSLTFSTSLHSLNLAPIEFCWWSHCFTTIILVITLFGTFVHKICEIWTTLGFSWSVVHPLLSHFEWLDLIEFGIGSLTGTLKVPTF